MGKRAAHPIIATVVVVWMALLSSCASTGTIGPGDSAHQAVVHDTIDIDGVKIFYREAGPKDAPTLFLLHGYPTSSHMFRELKRDLADQYHTLAPDYPGCGRSEQPPMAEFAYTFDHMAELMEKFLDAKGVDKFSVYLGRPAAATKEEKRGTQISQIDADSGG